MPIKSKAQRRKFAEPSSAEARPIGAPTNNGYLTSSALLGGRRLPLVSVFGD